MEAYIDTPYSAGYPLRNFQKESLPSAVEDTPADVQVAPLRIPSRGSTVATFLLSDAFALAAAVGLCYAFFGLFLGGRILTFLPALALLSVAYALSGLYTSPMHPAEEMRRVSIATTVFFGAFAAALFHVTEAQAPWRVSFQVGVAWGSTTLLVALSRTFVRILCARTSWWGYPVVILGQGEAGPAAVKTLRRLPELGLKPVALLDDKLTCEEVDGVPVCGAVSRAPALARESRIPYAIVAMPGVPHRKLIKMVDRYAKFYERLLILPGLASSQTLWSTSRFFSGMLGFDVQHSRRRVAVHRMKRAFDFFFALLGLVLLSPALLAIIVLIKLDSSGPIFFRQTRMGRGGRAFKVLKFRSMYTDAERRLRDILDQDEALRLEYETFRKLRRDPRVTRLGGILRRYSLDEIPQLWNVLRGEMSLVGPRAYTPNELEAMESMERIILQNPPGVTGLWQVSGRNNLNFEDRVSLDVHYTHNWSFWLDLYILTRTIPVVLTGEGAC